MSNNLKDLKIETNPSAIKKLRKKLLDCSYCRPHCGHNQKRKVGYGPTKPKSKEKRLKLTN